MQDFREIKVWQRAHTLTLNIYKLTNHFPKNELCGLVNQIRRSCSSIPTNIAEGSVQATDAQFARFLYIALGSAAELDYQLFLAYELEYIGKTDYKDLQSEVDQIKKMLATFVNRLKC